MSDLGNSPDRVSGEDLSEEEVDFQEVLSSSSQAPVNGVDVQTLFELILGLRDQLHAVEGRLPANQVPSPTVICSDPPRSPCVTSWSTASEPEDLLVSLPEALAKGLRGVNLVEPNLETVDRQ